MSDKNNFDKDEILGNSSKRKDQSLFHLHLKKEIVIIILITILKMKLIN